MEDKDVLNNNILKNEEFNIDFIEIFNLIKRNKKLIILTASLGFFISFYMAFTTKRTWEGQFQIVLDNKANQDAATALGGFINFDPTNELDTKVEILKSPSVLLDIFEFVKSEKFNLNKKNTISYAGWKKKLKINLTKNTTILNISYIDTDKELILPVLGKLSNKYKTYSLEKKSLRLQRSLNYFDKQINDFEERSLSSLKNVQEFALKHDLLIFDSNSIVDSTSNKLTANYVEARRVSSANQIRKIDQQIKFINNLDNDQYQLFNIASSLPNFEDNKYLLNSKRLVDILIDKSRYFKKGDVYISKLKDERDYNLRLLKETMIGFLNGQKNIAKASYEASIRPKGVIIEYQQLLKQSSRDDATLDFLKNQRLQLELEKERDLEIAELITEPTLLRDPVGPNRKKIISLGIIMGIILGTFLAKYQDYKKGIIYTTRVIDQLFGQFCIDLFQITNKKDWDEKIDLLLNITLANLSGDIAVKVIGDFKNQNIENFVENLNKKKSSKKFIIVNNLSETSKYQFYIFLTALKVTKVDEIKNTIKRLNLKEDKFLGHIVFELN